MENKFLIWLNWPIGAFKLNAQSLAIFKKLAKGAVSVANDEASFLKRLPTATHAIVWDFKKEWFARAKKLRVLATPAAGRELLPCDDEQPEGVVRVNGAFHGEIMSETVLAFMFAHARGLYAAYDFQKSACLWPRSEMSPHCSTLAGTKAVILGYGKIGRTIATKLNLLGVETVGISRKNFSSLKKELKTCDWLIVALPSDTGTDDLVNASVLKVMPPRAVLINVGRGNCVDEEALADALKRKAIGGAYLDVFKQEPLDESSPLAKELPGLVRMPHASAFAPQYLPLFFKELADGGWLA